MPDPGLHTVGRWTADRAAQAPHDVAMVTATGSVSYAELDARAAALAEALAAAGYRPGDRVASLTRNSPDHVVAFFAVAKAGLCLVPLSWRLTPAELSAQIADAAPSLVLTDETSEALAVAALRLSGIDPPLARLGRVGRGAAEVTVPFARPRSHTDTDTDTGTGAGPDAGRQPGRPAVDDDPLLIIYTSGSTGWPKGAVLTHGNCFWTSLSFSRVVPVRPEDVVLQVLPQFHVAGWTVQALLAWWVGATVVLPGGFDPPEILEWIARHRVTTMMGVPSTYQFLAEYPGFGDADLSSLRAVVVGGAATPEPVLAAWAARGLPLVQGYGLTEAGPNVLCVPPGSSGRGAVPYPHVDVALLDPSTSAAVPGPGMGELVVRGPNVFAGYWRNPQATAQVLRGGWLHTGDIAVRDADGGYRLRGRMGDMFISGGENVHPAEVERVLQEHPRVLEAAVLGVADQRWGEVGVAVVTLRPDDPGADPVTEADLLDHCRRRLAGFKVPRRVIVAADLPRLATGKVSKAALREVVAAAPDGPVGDGAAHGGGHR